MVDQGTGIKLSNEQFDRLVRLIETSAAMQAFRVQPDRQSEFESWQRLFEAAKVAAKESLVGESDA